MLFRLISILGLSATLALGVVHAEPRSYPNEVFDDLSLLFDIIKASNLFENIEDPQEFNRLYPGRTFADFDRNRSGGFVHKLDQGVDVQALQVVDGLAVPHCVGAGQGAVVQESVVHLLQ